MDYLKIFGDLLEIEKRFPEGWSLGLNYARKHIGVSLWNKSLQHENVHVCVICSDDFCYEKIIMARLERELAGYKEGIEEKRQQLLNELKALED
jgi:hypothetical protein